MVDNRHEHFCGPEHELFEAVRVFFAGITAQPFFGAVGADLHTKPAIDIGGDHLT